MWAPRRGMIRGQKELRTGGGMAGERLLIGVGEPDLPVGGGGLLLPEPETSSEKAEISAAYRDRPGRHQDDILATGTAAGNVVSQGIEPRAPDLTAVRSQQCRTDLHNEAPRTDQRLGRRRMNGRAGVPPARRAGSPRSRSQSRHGI